MMSMDQVPSELQGGSLQEKWWERHFRGFEAGLPLQLIVNLQPIFVDDQPHHYSEEKSIEELHRSRTTLLSEE